MAERSLRGAGIGSQSMETEDGVEFVERLETVYECPAGHRLVIPFAAQAEIPRTWQCRCGETAFLATCDGPRVVEGKKPRTHYDMVRERRSENELEELLAERLELLRDGGRLSHGALRA